MDGDDVCLTLLDAKSAEQVGAKVIGPAFSATCYGVAYCMPNKEIRAKGCEYMYKKFVADYAKNTKSQYTLLKQCNTNDIISKCLGAIQIYPPKSDRGVHRIPDEKQELNKGLPRGIWWVIKNPSIGVIIVYRAIRFIIGIHMIENRLMRHYPRYYQIECVAIKREEQSNGYGTKMIQYTHNEILNKIGDNENDKNIPIFLDSPSPRAIKFYKKNGYKVFVEVMLSSKTSMFGLVYHHNKNTLNKIYDKLTKNQQFTLKISFIRIFWKMSKKNKIKCLIMLCFGGPLFFLLWCVSKCLRLMGFGYPIEQIR